MNADFNDQVAHQDDRPHGRRCGIRKKHEHGPLCHPSCPTCSRCSDHKAVQHRDGKPPWCDFCGWTDFVPSRPARHKDNIKALEQP